MCNGADIVEMNVYGGQKNNSYPAFNESSGTQFPAGGGVIRCAQQKWHATQQLPYNIPAAALLGNHLLKTAIIVERKICSWLKELPCTGLPASCRLLRSYVLMIQKR